MLRRASIEDIKKIHTIINIAASRGEMLPRPLGELYDNMRDYFIYEEDKEIAGICGLHICWEDLAEIRSLCVIEDFRKRGIGRKLVESCIDEARNYKIENIFLLTYQDEFFKKIGFVTVDKKTLPHKIWTDCIKCPKFPACDEIAMIMKVRI